MPTASLSHAVWTWGYLWMLCELSFFPRSDSSSACDINASSVTNTFQTVSSAMSCIFDNGLCSYCNKGFISWTSEKGYIQARSINNKQKSQAVLQSQSVQLGFDPWCLYTEIRLEGKAQLLIVFFNQFNDKDTFSVPRVNLSESDSFNNVAVTVYNTNVSDGKLNHTLILEYDTTAQLRSIKMEEGSCTGPGNCFANRKTENCLWTSTNSTLCKWDSGNKNKDYSGPSEDHTTDGDYRYFWMNLLDLEPGESCSLQSVLSRKAEAGEEGCLKFWYHMDGEGDDSLSISVLSGSIALNEKILWTKSSNDTERVWNMGVVKIEMVLPFKVQFKGTRGTLGKFSSIALDDIEFNYTSDCEWTESSHNGRVLIVSGSCAAAVVVVIVFISIIVYKMKKNRELTLPSMSEPPLPLQENHSALYLSNTTDRLPVVEPERSLYDEIILDHSEQDLHIYNTLQESLSPLSAEIPRAPSDDTYSFTEIRVQNSDDLSPQVTGENVHDTNLIDSAHQVVDVNNFKFDEIEHQKREDDVDFGYEVAKTTESSEYNHLCCKVPELGVVQKEARHILGSKVGEPRVENRVSQLEDDTSPRFTEKHSTYMVLEVTNYCADELTNETVEDSGHCKQQQQNGDMDMRRRSDVDIYNHLFDKTGEQVVKLEKIGDDLQFEAVNTGLHDVASDN